MKNEIQLTNTDVALMMKAALEFNANIITIASAFYGNMGSKTAHKNFQKNIDATRDAYIKRLDEILGVL